MQIRCYTLAKSRVQTCLKMYTRLKIFALLLTVTLLYHWRILIGHQFSLLTGYEGANQAFAWFTFLARSVRSGTSLLWDPYSFAGHPFVTEMQNGAFYPANLLLAIFPFNSTGVMSPALYHWLYVLTHVFAAFFMYLLIRELGLSVFAGFLAGLGFALGGVMVRSGGWPHLFQSFIWFPLIFLFTLRALKGTSARDSALNAATAGMGVALSILAGGLYSAMMQAILIVAMAVFAACRQEHQAHPRSRMDVWARFLLVAGVAGLVAAAGSAAQLLPSLESGASTLRSVGPTMLPESQKIPYTYISGGMLPHSLIALFVVPMAFGGNLSSGELVSPYMGVLAFALAVIGIWKRWGNLWVRFLTGVLVVSFLYSMANLSIVHGVSYALIPKLWMAREASRALYLADFCLAVLCAFGTDALFSAEAHCWSRLWTVLKWTAAGCAVALAIGALFPKVELNPLVSLSLVLIVVVSVLLWRVTLGYRGGGMKFLFAGVLIFDLYAFDWSAANVIQERGKGTHQLERLLSFRSAAEFLRARPGPYRVQVLTDPVPNIGDAFGVEATWGAAATVVEVYWRYRDVSSIWNVRYSIRPATASEPGAIYADQAWKIYENPGAYPRAWLVHKAIVEPSEERLGTRLRDASFNARDVALIRAASGAPLAGGSSDSSDRIELRGYRAANPVLSVDTASDCLLVLSEVYYPGWRATVNGMPVPVERVDGALRGVRVPRGHSRVELTYRPVAQIAGLFLTVLTFVIMGGLWLAARRPDAA
jgi:Bacterial membrane protein YfhO